MAKAKGSPKTGGRKKGTPNAKNAALIEAVERTGTTPLAHLLRVMRNPKAGQSERFEAAKAAAPYVHPKLAAIEHTGKNGDAINLSLRVLFGKADA